MSCRLHITAEGQTEQYYANRVLAPHLWKVCQIVADARSVKTGRKHGRDYRGGLLSYEKARQDILDWMKQEAKNEDVWFTTMFDLYALPGDFPGWEEAHGMQDPYEKVRILEEALGKAVDHPRFIPYIQLHEFEALILADPQKLDSQYLKHATPIRHLVAMVAGRNPEEINDDPKTAPSKRIIAQIPPYKNQKAAVGPAVAELIGLDTIRARCRHFDQWLSKIEGLGSLGSGKG